MKILGIIGAGNMASAITKGIISNNTISPSDMMVFDIDAEKLNSFSALGIAKATSENEIVRQCHYVLLAVKPQIYSLVLSKISADCSKKNVFISIAAGISGDYIKNIIGQDEKIVLVMPNTPVLVGCGSSALSCISPTTSEEFDEVMKIFAASGLAVEIDPGLMREVIPINGSSPAVFYWMAKIFVEKAVEQGFDFNTANQLFCKTMEGSAKMILQAGKSHQDLIDMVSSKGGTTLAMRNAMEESGFRQSLINGIDACIQRAKELGTLL